jgi:tetraacyldisaccharide 4'-kinase
MRPPGWWYEADGVAGRLLAPLGALYAAGTAWRLARTAPLRAEVPVICVGNLDAGGTGKTPVVMALAERLSSQGLAVHVVSRGHGGRLAGPVRVLPSHRAEEVGTSRSSCRPSRPSGWRATARPGSGRRPRRRRSR